MHTHQLLSTRLFFISIRYTIYTIWALMLNGRLIKQRIDCSLTSNTQQQQHSQIVWDAGLCECVWMCVLGYTYEIGLHLQTCNRNYNRSIGNARNGQPRPFTAFRIKGRAKRSKSLYAWCWIANRAKCNLSRCRWLLLYPYIQPIPWIISWTRRAEG